MRTVLDLALKYSFKRLVHLLWRRIEHLVLVYQSSWASGIRIEQLVSKEGFLPLSYTLHPNFFFVHLHVCVSFLAFGHVINTETLLPAPQKFPCRCIVSSPRFFQSMAAISEFENSSTFSNISRTSSWNHEFQCKSTYKKVQCYPRADASTLVKIYHIQIMCQIKYHLSFVIFL